MKTAGVLFATLSVLFAASAAKAANFQNDDPEALVLSLSTDGEKTEMTIGSGESLTACEAGCFVTFPNGDRIGLSGGETIVIVGGTGSIQ